MRNLHYIPGLVCLLMFQGHLSQEHAAGVRLVGVPSTRSGRLEIMLGNTSSWHPVCKDRFSLNDARVVCRILGFSSERPIERYLVQKRYPSLPVNLNFLIFHSPGCHGYETSLEQCIRYRQLHLSMDCVGGAVGIECSHNNNTPVYELVRGSRTKGILSAQYQGITWYARWDYFRKSAAHIACRSMGLPYTSVLISRRDSHVEFKEPVKPVAFLCNGNENSLINCSAWGHKQFLQTYIVEIECRDTERDKYNLRLDDRLSSFAGRVQMVNNGQWADVCLQHVDDDVATIFCKHLQSQLGIGLQFGKAHVLSLSLFTTSVRNAVMLDQFRCPTNADRIYQCSWSRTLNYCLGTRLAISCVPPNLMQREFRLAGRRLEVRRYGLWGAVCYSSLSSKALTMQICLDGSIRKSDEPAVHNLAWMEIESCNDIDQELTLACIHKTITSRRCGITTHPISVYCDISQYIDDAPMQLVGGETDYEGRVEIKLRGRWGGICTTDHPSEYLASTICTSLQLSSAGAEIRNAVSFGGGAHKRIHLDNVHCRGYGHSLGKCELELSTQNRCPVWDELAVSCTSRTGSRPSTNVAVIAGSVCGVALLVAIIILVTCIVRRRSLLGGMPLQARTSSRSGADNAQAHPRSSAHASGREETAPTSRHDDAPPDYFVTVRYQNREGDVIDMNFGSHGSRAADESRQAEGLPPKYEDLFPGEGQQAVETTEESHEDRSRDSSGATPDGADTLSRLEHRALSPRPQFV